MLQILTGQDDFSRSEALAEIKKGLGDPALASANTTVLDGHVLTLDQLGSAGETMPFLAEKRLVIVERLLERFESQNRLGRPKKRTTAKSNQKDDYRLWVERISRLPESTTLVLVDGRVGSANPLLKELSGRAEVKTFPLLGKTRLRQWIEKRVGEGKGNISPQAVELLAQLVGSDLWSAQHEISKLVLFAKGRPIEEDDVRKLVGYAQQTSVFTMVDAILELEAGLAQQSLQDLLDGGAAPAYLMVMLSRQTRMIARVKELKNQGKSEMEIQNRLGLTSEYAFRKTLAQASQFTMERISEIYHRLLQTDLAIKTGKYDGELALNILVAELSQRA